MICLHGTVKELSFLVNSFKKTSCWSCSEADDYVYVWVPALFESDFDNSVELNLAEDEWSDAALEAFRFAKDSAITQAGYNGQSTDLFIYVLDVPSKLLKPDNSCPNMDGANRFKKENFDVAWIKAVFHRKFSGYYSPFVLSGLHMNEYFNFHSCDEELQKLAVSLKHSEATSDVWETLQEDWAEVDLDAHLQSVLQYSNINERG